MAVLAVKPASSRRRVRARRAAHLDQFIRLLNLLDPLGLSPAHNSINVGCSPLSDCAVWSVLVFRLVERQQNRRLEAGERNNPRHPRHHISDQYRRLVSR